MRTVRLKDAIDFDGWRTAARALAAEGMPPEDVVWQVEGEGEDLFNDPSPLMGEGGPRSGSDGGADEALNALDGERVARGRAPDPNRPRHGPGVQARAERLSKQPTVNEERLWQAFRKLDLNIRRQAPVGRFVVDFVQHSAKLVIEIDGEHWHSTVEAKTRDAERDAWLDSQRYFVLRIADDEVSRDLEGVSRRIADRVRERLPRPATGATPPPFDRSAATFPHEGGRNTTASPSSPTHYGRADGGQSATPAFTVPRAFIDLAQYVICHGDPERFALLYRLLWRLRTERGLLHVAVDPDVARAEALSKAVRRDIHKMRAYVRFREIADPDDGDAGPLHVAWFEPEHHILEINAPFFVRRFAGMRWAILTPERSARWDGDRLTFGPGASKADAPEADAMEEVWRGYYASIFNPARLKVRAMQGHMPRKYWRNLPEAELIAPLVKEAARRTQTMVEEAPSEPARRRMRAAPEHADEAHRYGDPVAGSGHDGLDALRAQAAGCRACPLWEPATQTVFGEGPASARVMFVGEQPGDQEDLAGRPFVGPAGGVFNRALAEAGVDRSAVYVTNAVKHFKFEPRGKFRLHQKPTGAEIKICNRWLQNEIEIIEPELIVALGATAAQALLGRAVTIGRVRGVIQPFGEDQQMLVTVHPSFLLRLPDEERKAEEYARFVDDLRLAAPRVAP